MLNHLLKRCPSMTQEDRNLAFLHMQQTSNGPGKTKKQAASNQANLQDAGHVQPQLSLDALQGMGQETLMNDSMAEHRQQMPQMMQQNSHEGPSSNVPLHMLMQRQQSALDTLAEVSRRHMDYSIHSHGYAIDMQQPTMPRQVDRGLVEHALLAALQRQDTNDNLVPRPIESIDMPMYQAYAAQAQAGAEQAVFSDAQISLPLEHSATSVTHQVDQRNLEPDNEPIDPQLNEPMDADEPMLSAQDHEAHRQSQDDFISWTEAPQDFVTQQEPPSNEPNPEFGPIHRSDKTNARARFTDTRRKEVQEIRKRGACMRCRMLKKPCSEGTPCGTCKKIDSARLWKDTCLRTKLAEEFTLYSTSYFHSQMVEKVSGAVQALSCVSLTGSIQIKFVPHCTLAMAFGAKRYFSPANTQTIDRNSQLDDAANLTTNQDIIVLDDGIASQKVSDYCMNNAILQYCIRNEKSAFLRTTLQEAVALLELEKSQEKPSDAKSRSRTNHISPSVLLSNVIELWIETNVLVRSRQGSLHICYNPNLLPNQGSQTGDWPEDSSQSTLPVPPNSPSYDLICSQILMATETTCHRLSKAVMNELERRLLQRQQVSAFATFISAVILFSCIERITSFYYSLDPSPSSGTAFEPNSQPGTELRPPGYPTTMPAPSTLWPQGPHFARLLATLLRMRALPPKTTRTADNKLAVLREPSIPVRLNGVAVREQQDAETARATNWLDPLGLDVEALRTRRDGDINEVGWEMKFISAVLLSEGM
jgi:hypothetical protein